MAYTFKQVRNYFRQLYHITTSPAICESQTYVQHTQQYRNVWHQDATHVVKQITTNIIAHKQNYDVCGATYQTTTWNQFVHTNTFHVDTADKSDIMGKAEKPALCPTAIEMSTSNTCQLCLLIKMGALQCNEQQAFTYATILLVMAT